MRSIIVLVSIDIHCMDKNKESQGTGLEFHYKHYAFVYVLEYVLILPESMKYFRNRCFSAFIEFLQTVIIIMEMNEGNEANNLILYGFI